MNQLTTGNLGGLSALLICPNDDLAQAVTASFQGVEGLSIVGTLAQYPSGHELSDCVQRHRPEVVLIDVSSKREPALQLIAQVVDYWPDISAVGVSDANDPEAILQCLRNGASEFLANPFSASDVQQAVQRIHRRKAVEIPQKSPQRGSLIVFAPVKGGSGATTIASSTAYAIERAGGGRVLLADLNLTTGLIAFLFRAQHPYSFMDAVRHSSQLDQTLWKSLVIERSGVDLLTAPERPEASDANSYPVQEVLEYARSIYDHTVVDVASVWDNVSLAALPLADAVYLVCSSDLPSLYLMRRSIQVLEETGYSRDQVRVLVNRLSKRTDLSIEDMEKIFRSSVHATFPDDPAGVSRALREGAAIAENTALGKTVKEFAGAMLAARKQATAKSLGVGALKEILSGT